MRGGQAHAGILVVLGWFTWRIRLRSALGGCDSPEIEGDDTPDFFSLLKISYPENLEIEHFVLLPEASWKQDEKLTRNLGDRWLAEGKTCLARVPSVIVTET
jgi:hypothetical protein